ncbi:hypothetical protein [Variovorax sp. PAMC26660]|uniref:hypothetical protein n=1 Tax=Variovorax sp. PAMC26660 TaxID=2762322 RepID=UPI00164E99D8|nr:hypothetical protein [Variovorax sp. PAMC26660]QNK66348.1 hypothetical protein H7F35_24580 [Variovorax sp. PAMC26660]
MTKQTAAWLGFLIAPLISSVVLALGSPAMTQGTATGYLATVALFYVASLVPTAMLAVPAFLLLLALKLVRWWSTIGFGFVAGCGVSALIQFSRPIVASELAPMGFAGAAATLGFWIIWTSGKDQ